MKSKFYSCLLLVAILPLTMQGQQGTLDNNFATAGRMIQNIGFAGVDVRVVLQQTDGKIIVAGSAEQIATSMDFVLARFNTNGTLDNSFDGDGIVRTDIGAGGKNQLVSAVLLPTGKILVAGIGTDNVLVQYNTNGSLDPSFDGDGIFLITSPGNFTAADMLVQPDGKIVVAGEGVTSPSSYVLVRLLPQGGYDNSFDGDGISVLSINSDYFTARAVALQPADNKILVTGTSADLFAQTQLITTVRVNTNGTIDNTFSGIGWISQEAGPETDDAFDIVVQSNGAILVTGFSEDDGLSYAYTFALRYTAAGTPDNTFDSDGILNISNTSNFLSLGQTQLESGDKIMLSGIYKNPSGVYGFALCRLNSNGSFDAGFGVNGIAAAPVPLHQQLGTALLQQSDGKFLVAGFQSNGILFQPTLYRTLSNGLPDNSFDGDGIATVSFTNDPGDDLGAAMAMLPGDLFIVGGNYMRGLETGGYIARYAANGTLDNSFGINGVAYVSTGFSSSVESIVVQPDGKILVCGLFYELFAGAEAYIARFLANGTIDAGFGNNGLVVFSAASKRVDYGFSIALQSDGKIIAYMASLDFVTFSSQQYLFRFTANGAVDLSFGSSGKVLTAVELGGDQGYTQRIVIQPDNKILLTGTASGTGNSNFAVQRFNSNGTVDNSFNGGNMVTTDFSNDQDDTYCITLQADGKIIVVGTTPSTGGGARKIGLVRYNSNGTLDNSFDGDGRVVISGLNFNQTPSSVLIQADGKILIGGFTNDASFNHSMLVVRLNTAGNPDATFGTGGIAVVPFAGDGQDYGRSMALQSTGRILLSGSVQQSGSNNLAVYRLLNTVTTGIGNSRVEMKHLKASPNPVTDLLRITSNRMVPGKYAVQVRTIEGKLVYSTLLVVNGNVLQLELPTTGWPCGMLVVEVKGGGQFASFRIVKHLP